MKFISIVPLKFMYHALLTSDTTLVLAHLIENGNDYHRECLKFQRMGGKLIMDNSFYELRKNMPILELAEKANTIHAHIVVLPDLPFSLNLKHEVEDAISKLRFLGVKAKFMCCVFANNRDFKDDLENFRILNSINDLDIIAIPYVFRREDEFRRPDFLNLIEREIGVENIKKQIHLFGCKSLVNLKKEKRKWIQSIDGTMPWKCGFYNKKLPISVDKEPKRPPYYFDIENLNSNQRKNIDYNLSWIKKVCKK